MEENRSVTARINRKSHGVLYIATGRDHIRAALQSAQSVRKTNPHVPIHLFGDWQQHGFKFDDKSPLTSWENIADPHRRSKVDYMIQTPFLRTLYLDTDTRVLCSLDDLFNLLEKFDIALAHAHRREIPSKQAKVKIQTPNSFPQFNSGVFLYKRNTKTTRVLKQWRQWFYEAELPTDQNTLKEILWESDLRIATLPPEYNVRFIKYLLFWSKSEARAKILHLPYYKEGLATYIKRLRRKFLQGIKRLYK
jgi:hypothetical protein